MTINGVLKRGIYILKKEGAKSFLNQVFSFLAGFFYCQGTYYIYEKPLTKDERYFFEPKLPNVEVKIISTPEEFEQLDSNGYDFKMMHFKDKLEKGCLAFCAFANKELAHVTWAALSEKAKKEIDYLPFGVAFQNKEACSGASFTDPKYRGKGLFSYVYAVIFPYLAQRGIVKDKFTIEVSNISSQKAHAKFNPNITGKGHYLKILWWKFWREEPIKELKEI